MKPVCILTGSTGAFGRRFIELLHEDLTIVAVESGAERGGASKDGCLLDPLTGCTGPRNFEGPDVRVCDLSSEAARRRLCQDVVNDYGKVDIFVHAATARAIISLRDPSVASALQSNFMIDVVASAGICQSLLDLCWSKDVQDNIEHNRCVLNISSLAGVYVYEGYNQGVYATSKAALNQLSYHLASEYWDAGIRINAIAPNSFGSHVALDDVIEDAKRLMFGSQTGEVSLFP